MNFWLGFIGGIILGWVFRGYVHYYTNKKKKEVESKNGLPK